MANSPPDSDVEAINILAIAYYIYYFLCRHLISDNIFQYFYYFQYLMCVAPSSRSNHSTAFVISFVVIQSLL